MGRIQSIVLRLRSLGLLRSFALLSFVSITATTAISAWLVLRFVSDHLMARDAAVTMHFLQSVADIENLGDELQRPRALQTEEGFGEFFRHVGRMPDVVAAVVYSPDQSVIWSSQSELVGRRLGENDELEDALRGRLIHEMVHHRESGKEEHSNIPLQVTLFVENYLPIRDVRGQDVIAVAEIYKVPRALLDALDEGRRLVWTTAAGSGLFLWLVLYWVVRRAANLIEEQHGKLIESERYTAVGEMATAVAHGIRNPLASIRSSAELATDADSPELVRETTADIISEVDRLERWVKDLLVSSRLEDTVIERIRIDELVREHLATLSRRMERAGIELVLDLGETPPIRGDAPLLRQMFDSLLSNAFEAMPDGGSLTVRTGSAPDRSDVRLTITDTGPGIPAAIAKQVFSPLVTSKRNGLGLGLALVKRIVERHDGEIDLSSAPGAGTTARLRFRAMRR